MKLALTAVFTMVRGRNGVAKRLTEPSLPESLKRLQSAGMAIAALGSQKRVKIIALSNLSGMGEPKS